MSFCIGHVSTCKRLIFRSSKNLRQEPKYIVLHSHLLLLFKFCHNGKADNPLLETTTDGTLLVVKTSCANPSCGQQQCVWKSEPLMPRTKVNPSDFLLSFAILLSGGSLTKVVNMFRLMGLAGISMDSYYRHQSVCMIYTVMFCSCLL